MKPSTGPVLQLSVSPALTASRSFFNPAANFLITAASDASASSSHLSSFSPSRFSDHLRELLG